MYIYIYIYVYIYIYIYGKILKGVDKVYFPVLASNCVPYSLQLNICLAF